jgi:arylsulfatase
VKRFPEISRDKIPSCSVYCRTDTMKSRTRLFLLLAFVTAFCSATVFAAAKPNIVLLMPDDMGWGDIAAHGNPLIQTPVLDKFHGESVRFTDFHVSPTCSPTRSAIMTGRHEFKNGVTHTILERERMTLKATTLPQVLKTAGYTTGIFGKWHLGDEAEYQPGVRGFDEVFIHGAGGIGQTYPGSCGDFPDNKYFDPAVLHNKTIVKTKGYCTDVFMDQAGKWISAQAKAGKPFFAYITPNAPHGPLVSPGPKYDALYEGKSIEGKPLDAGSVAYYSMISNIDENFGKLLATLKQLGIENDTLVIFMSDNGGTHTRLYSGGFRGGKGQVYHGGTHAPSFWRWPAAFQGGKDTPALSAHLDILPTLADITGIKLTGAVAKQVEGRSLLPQLKSPGAPWPDRFLVTHQGRWPIGKAAQSKHSNCSIRNAQFRLVNNTELYDLKADRGETTNVIGQHPEVVAAFRAAYDKWWDETLPMMVNEDATGPKMNPMKEMYWKQFGGGPDEDLRKLMDPAGRATWGQPAAKAATKDAKKKKKAN